MRPWGEAIRDALYGPRGYYTRGAGAGGFLTSARSAAYAGALARLAVEVDELLGRPAAFDLVDVGAGDGGLLLGVAAAVPAELRGRLRATAVEVRGRPAGLPATVGWRPDIPAVHGLLVANEWLDVVPLDVVADGRLLLVDELGNEVPGAPPDAADVRWLDAWWPGWRGQRAEVGRGRDEAWAGAVGQVTRGLAVAVDYAHRRDDRPADGTLVGYRDGRAVAPVPDGGRDLTAHVALDACAAAAAALLGDRDGAGQAVPAADRAGRGTDGRSPRSPAAAAGAGGAVVITQRAALRALGVTGGLPAYGGDPRAYAARLAAAGEEAALLDPAGLGGFGWLAQPVGIPLPASLAASAGSAADG